MLKQYEIRGLSQTEIHLGAIRNLYWHLRAIRPWEQAKRRKLYRKIAKEKAVLIADGFDPEGLRLWCRQFSRCYQQAAKARYEAHVQKSDTFFENTRKE